MMFSGKNILPFSWYCWLFSISLQWRYNKHYIPSCTVAKVNLDAFGDDVLSVPECGDMTEKNKIQESLSRFILIR